MSEKKLLHYAIWLLSRRPYHTAELKSKIQKHGGTVEEAETVLKKLRVYGYVNDELFVKDFIRSQLRSKPQGLRLIQQKLRIKGVSVDEIKHALDEYQDTELERAEMAIIKKSKSMKDDSPIQKKQKIARFLLGRGFSGDTVHKALSQTNLYNNIQ